MTLDEAIAHAQAETQRADRERTLRIAAEEKLDATIKWSIGQHVTFDGDTYYAPKLVVLALALGWFFEGVREVMRHRSSCPDCARWTERVKELEQRVAKIREVVR